MSAMNDAVCNNGLNGWCDRLGKNPKNYLFAFILSLVFNYLIPVAVLYIIIFVIGNTFTASNIMMLFSPVFPGITSVYLTTSVLNIVLMASIILVVDVLYLIYMTRQLGVYVIVPIATEIIKWTIVLFFPDFLVIAVVISLIPFMTISVSVHFIAYNLERGIITRKT